MFLTVFGVTRQPDRMAAAIRVFYAGIDNVKTVCIEKSTIFARVQAGMVERLAAQFSDGLAVFWAAGKQKRCARRGVGIKTANMCL